MTKISFHRRHVRRAFLALALAVSAGLPQRVLAQPAPALPSALAGIIPLSDQTMRGISGTGLVLTKANTLAPGSGGVVLWDEVARNPRIVVKSVPGLRVTVNGVPQ